MKIQCIYKVEVKNATNFFPHLTSADRAEWR